MQQPTRKKKERSRKRKKDDFVLVYNKAINLLSYRPRSEKELHARLLQFARKKDLDEYQKAVGRVLNLLREEGKVNDLEFAKWWIGQRVDFKPRGKKLLRQELHNKGVDEETFNQAVEYFWQEERDGLGVKREAISEVFLAEKAARNKLNSFGRLSVFEFGQKMIRYLLRLGFEYETCRQVVEKLKRDNGTERKNYE